MSDHPPTEIVAALLASGIMAAPGKIYTPARAISLWRAVLGKLRGDSSGDASE